MSKADSTGSQSARPCAPAGRTMIDDELLASGGAPRDGLGMAGDVANAVGVGLAAVPTRGTGASSGGALVLVSTADVRPPPTAAPNATPSRTRPLRLPAAGPVLAAARS